MKVQLTIVAIKIDLNFNFEPYLYLFSPLQLAKIKAYHFRADQVRAFTSELLKYHYLAAYLKLTPSLIIINLNQYGKPYLYSNSAAIDFNLAHSGEYVVMAIAKNAQVGIDIEKINSEIVPEELAPIIFSVSEQALLKNDVVNFFTLWAKKEALIKALGSGFAVSEAYSATNLNLESFQLVDQHLIYSQRLAADYSFAIALNCN